jgi:hypothetical protein
MPHQCLKCGTLFEDGSPELLKGCPNCGGNRFFYTKDELDETQREQIRKEVGKDINEQLIELLGKHQADVVDQTGNWITMKPKDVRKALTQHLPEKKHLPQKNKQTGSEDITDPVSDAYRKKRLDELLREHAQAKKPETIDIQPPGKYNIDVKALLENEPIIIQKDGSYTIHLPSIFKMYQEKNKK